MSKSLISGLKVLLADDSVTMHRAVSLALKKLSCELLLADNGSDAERIIKEQHPEVVLLDWDLPEKSGLELCREIKANPETDSTKVVLLLSSFEKMDEAELNSVPSDARLWKPFEANVLQTMIETLVKEKNSDDESAPSTTIESTAPVKSQGKTAFEETAPLTPSNPGPMRPSAMKLGARDSSAPKVVSFSTTLSSPKGPTKPPVPAPLKPHSVEATIPPPPQSAKRLSIDDLFKGGGKEKENASREDISKELTAETFRSTAFPDENIVDGTRKSDFSEIEAESVDFNDLTAEEQEALGQMHETLDLAHSQSLKTPPKAEPSLWGEEKHTPVPPLPSEKAREKLALPKRTSAELTNPGTRRTEPSKHVWEEEKSASSINKQMNSDEVRRIIGEELEKKFKGWLKEEVESQLARVMRELDADHE